MRCIAIDDEPMALSIIEQYCQRYGGLELERFTNPTQGFERICSTTPDLLFLDIEMGETNGVELARRLPQGVRVIFTTAYAQFAIDGFELNAVDFLHKPFSFTRFERAVNKAQQLVLRDQTEASDEITVKVEYQSVKINTSTINFVESMDNYIKIHLSEQRTIISQMSLKAIDELLPKERFCRVHKSFIVSRNRVASFNRSQIILNGSTTPIPIGRTYQSAFQDWISRS